VYTSFFLLAAALAPGADLAGWHTDYHGARRVSAHEHRPLAVIMGSGRAGWEQLHLDETARWLLTDHYVPVYIDTSTPDGRGLATAFGIRSGQGIVLSDHSGEHQAFWHEGRLPGSDLVQNLQRFATIQVAYTTETMRGPGTIYYPSGAVQPTAYQFAQPFFGGYRGAACST
jgi:hypothetical protein